MPRAPIVTRHNASASLLSVVVASSQQGESEPGLGRLNLATDF